MVKKRQKDLDTSELQGGLSTAVQLTRSSQISQTSRKKKAKKDQLKNAARMLLAGQSSTSTEAEADQEQTLYSLSTLPKGKDRSVTGNVLNSKDSTPGKHTETSMVTEIGSASSKRDDSQAKLELSGESETTDAMSEEIPDGLNAVNLNPFKETRITRKEKKQNVLSKANRIAAVDPNLQPVTRSKEKPVAQFMKEMATSSQSFPDFPRMDEESTDTVNPNDDTSCVYEEDFRVVKNEQVVYKCNDCVLVAFTEQVELIGGTEIQLFKGYVEVHGYPLSPAEKVTAYSLAGYCNTVIKNLHDAREFEVDTVKDILGSKALEKLNTFIHAHSDCALIKISYKLPSCYDFCRTDLPALPSSKGMMQIWSNRLYLSDSTLLHERYSWRTLAAVDMIDKLVEQGSAVRILVVGAKNTGKSTLTKYLINRLQHSSLTGVMHMDCDVGQTEFALPGAVSLTHVTKPLLGPPWTHDIAPSHVELYGALSPDSDLNHYMKCINKLSDLYTDKYNTKPLIVNTMGWVQGLGLHILSATINLLKPTHILQLGVSIESYKNFQLFNKLKATEYDMLLDKNQLRQMMSEVDYEVIPLTVQHLHDADSRKRTSALKPSSSRDLKVLSYFSQLITQENTKLHHVTPYCIQCSNVYIRLTSRREHTTPEMVLRALNLSIVALCHDATLKSATDDLNITTRIHGNLLGYGLVRAVDMKDNKLYIITPLSDTELLPVNLIVRLNGNCVPDSLIYSQGFETLSYSGYLPHIDRPLSAPDMGQKTNFRSRRQVLNKTFT